MAEKKQHDEPVVDKLAAEADRQAHLVDPLTDPSSGNPPAGVTPQGDRMGSAEEAAPEKAEKTPAQKAAAKERAADRAEAKAEKAEQADEKAAAAAKAKAEKVAEQEKSVEQSSSWGVPPFWKPADKP